jgi:uncharacterized membrane protein YqiK
MFTTVTFAVIIFIAFLLIVTLIFIANCYKKAEQGMALIKTGVGGTHVSFSGMIVIPVLHRLELMDISLKTVVISRQGKEGLICKDNLRADIKVTFFVRVNKTQEDVIQVGQSIGCRRASDTKALEDLFDAKFSEALKTVGKKFDFIELYNSRELFKQEILQIIGTDLNGYILDDCAIDYLEQTHIESLNENNILDAEGIKKIIELTAKQKVLANHFEREKEKTITQQNVEAKEAILELNRQLAETEEKQKREIASIRAREESETAVIQQQERLKSEKARIQTEEESRVAEENRDRQIIVAQKNKERVEAVERERVDKDRLLEITEKQRIVTLADIAKEKAIEEERKNIQEVIRERVSVQKAVVMEEEKIKDTQAFALADREKSVAIKRAEMLAEEALVQQIKAAEADRQSAELKAKRLVVEAEAEQATAGKKAEAIKILADAEAAKAAASGVAEAQVIQAKALAKEKDGKADATIIENKAIAEARGIEVMAKAQAEADEKLGLVAAKINKEKGMADASVIEVKAQAEEKKGLTEAKIMHEKFTAEAKGIESKADAMRKLDGVGKEHEEFKLRLQKEKDVELAMINIQKAIADAQATVLGEALKVSKIDIVGGETMFFDKLVNSVSNGKSVDKLFTNSHVLTDVKNTFFTNGNGNGHSNSKDDPKTIFRENLKKLVDQFGITSEDVKNLSVAALLMQMSKLADDKESKGLLNQLMQMAKKKGVSDDAAQTLGIW